MTVKLVSLELISGVQIAVLVHQTINRRRIGQGAFFTVHKRPAAILTRKNNETTCIFDPLGQSIEIADFDTEFPHARSGFETNPH